MMSEYGVDSLRYFSTIEFSDNETEIIMKMIDEAEANRFICGTSGHSAKDCHMNIRIIRCHRCRRKGHDIDNCYAKTDINGKVLSSNIKCFRCGRKGHTINDCYEKMHILGIKLSESYNDGCYAGAKDYIVNDCHGINANETRIPRGMCRIL